MCIDGLIIWPELEKGVMSNGVWFGNRRHVIHVDEMFDVKWIFP